MALLDWIFGYEDPAEKSLPYLNKIPEQTKGYYEPYIERGNRAGNILENQYARLVREPNKVLSDIGSGFRESPGFEHAIRKALSGSDRAAAAHGLTASPSHQIQNMELANQLANQDYWNYLNHALNLFGEGLGGEKGLYGIGVGSSKSLADTIAQTLAQKAGVQFAGTQSHNQFMDDILSKIFLGGTHLLGVNQQSSPSQLLPSNTNVGGNL